MQQKITGEFSSVHLSSLLEDRLSITLFIEDILKQDNLLNSFIISLKTINMNHGASPDILDLKLTNVKFNKTNLLGSLSIVYQLDLYWGCSASNTQRNTESVWTFKLNTENNTIDFYGPEETERSTYEEF